MRCARLEASANKTEREGTLPPTGTSSGSPQVYSLSTHRDCARCNSGPPMQRSHKLSPKSPSWRSIADFVTVSTRESLDVPWLRASEPDRLTQIDWRVSIASVAKWTVSTDKVIRY